MHNPTLQIQLQYHVLFPYERLNQQLTGRKADFASKPKFHPKIECVLRFTFKLYVPSTYTTSIDTALGFILFATVRNGGCTLHN